MVRRFGCDPLPLDGGAKALEVLKSPSGGSIELIILDLNMPGMDGLEFLERLQAVRGDLPVIVQTAQGSIETVVKAMRAGADDFVVKPISPERLKISIQNLLKVNALTEEVKRLNKRVGGALTFNDLIATSPAMGNVLRLGRRGAQSNIPILIEGESGVGKEMIARAIQGESERSGRPFVAVNCGALPENLVESILFGHEKGAFTGATQRHSGKFQEADGGTLFLDEVAELPLDMQRPPPGEGEHPPHLGHQPQHDRDGEGRAIPRGSLLPPQRLPHHGAAAPAAHGGHPRTRGAFHHALRC